MFATICRGGTVFGFTKVHPKYTNEEMALQIGVKKRTVERNTQMLKSEGVIIRHGSDKNGYWSVNEGF